MLRFPRGDRVPRGGARIRRVGARARTHSRSRRPQAAAQDRGDRILVHLGAGASSSAATYPSRLEAELKARLPGLPITVVNKGIGGEEAAQMVARFDADVIEESPDLVLWQVGSNSVLRDRPTPGEVIRRVSSD